MTQIKSLVKPNGILDYFRRESVTLIHFGLGHELNTGRLGVNLSAPKAGHPKAVKILGL